MIREKLMSPGMCFLIGLSVPGADGGNAMRGWPVEKERQSERRQSFQGSRGYLQEQNSAANSHLDKEHTENGYVWLWSMGQGTAQEFRAEGVSFPLS